MSERIASIKVVPWLVAVIESELAVFQALLQLLAQVLGLGEAADEKEVLPHVSSGEVLHVRTNIAWKLWRGAVEDPGDALLYKPD